MRKFFLATAASALLSLGTAHAAPLLQYQILDGGTVIGSGSSSTGNIIGSGSDSNFSVSLNATGAPFLGVPNFSNNSYTVSSSGAGTLTIKVTDIGLTGFTAGQIANTFSLNSLNGGGFQTATISNYFDNSNTAFGTGTLLGTASFTGKSSFASQTSLVNTMPSNPFSETAIYVLTYGAGDGNGTVSASSQMAVPEPASLALIGSGLFVTGLIRGRGRSRLTQTAS